MNLLLNDTELQISITRNTTSSNNIRLKFSSRLKESNTNFIGTNSINIGIELTTNSTRRSRKKRNSKKRKGSFSASKKVP